MYTFHNNDRPAGRAVVLRNNLNWRVGRETRADQPVPRTRRLVALSFPCPQMRAGRAPAAAVVPVVYSVVGSAVVKVFSYISQMAPWHVTSEIYCVLFFFSRTVSIQPVNIGTRAARRTEARRSRCSHHARQSFFLPSLHFSMMRCTILVQIQIPVCYEINIYIAISIFLLGV